MRQLVIIKIDPKRPNRSIIASTAEIIKRGGLVAFPTETVYGIAANLRSVKAINKLRRIKKRSQNKPFTVHISDIKMIRVMGCKITKEAKCLIDRFWPGPLTIILRSKKYGSIGFRMPANKVALDLIRASSVPIVAPSANLSGQSAPTSAKEISKALAEKLDIILDAGKTEIGIESTVIDLTVSPPKVLREGAISKGEIRRCLAFSG